MNNIFKILFGIPPEDIQNNVIIMPFDIPQAAAHLGVQRLINGKLFACGQGKSFTLIRSGMSASFVGDCILWLEETPCQKILFLGTCGLIEHKQNLDIGSIVTPKTIYAMESFSEIVTETVKTPTAIPGNDQLIDPDTLRVNCVSFSSLHEETKHINLFKKLDAAVIEMECAAFFLAAQKINRTSSALLVISDIIGDNSICFNLSAENKKKLANGIYQACHMIKTILR